MRNYFFVSLALIALVALFAIRLSQKNQKGQEQFPGSGSSTQGIEPNETDVVYNGQSFKINWSSVSNPRDILLGANLDEKKTAKNIFEENRCKALVNGGFYTDNSDYIGLLYLGGKKLSNESDNPLFNGVFYTTKDGDVGIGSGVPLDQIKFAVQSGPILVRYRAYQRLRLPGDTSERRTLVAVTDKKEVYFLAVFSPQSTYLGPKLTELPEILKKFADSKDVYFTDALNLDGGAHSAFLGPGVSLDELSPIGSYLCVK